MADASLIDSHATFSSFSHLVDARLLRALADMGYAKPTLIQTKAIPIALEGRDILAKARTGSGKTAAYCVPLVQKILSAKASTGEEESNVRALILVPTRELSEQVARHLRQLLVYCEKEVTVANLASGASTHSQRILMSDKPDIVIATPSRALNALQNQMTSFSSIETLVIDEADLVLSFGHDEDVHQIFNGSYLPKVHQSFLMSATMTKDVESLKGLTLRSPAILRLEEDEDDAARLSQYAVKCNEVDKFLLTYVILKLKLVKGKCIIFVNDVDRCYRIKLFLEQFSIKSCVLNSELPLNSRVHIVQEFNKGIYDYIIATDESNGNVEEDELEDQDAEDVEAEDEAGEKIEEFTSTQREPAQVPQEGEPGPSTLKRKRREATPPPQKSGQSAKKKNKQPKSDKEYGVVRGVDFIDVACVLNFDLPPSSRAYTHRVGRTARAGRTGMALSFVVPREEWGKNKVVGGLASAKNDENMFAKIEKEQAARGSKIKEYKFDMKQVEAFRYRMQDALRSVTRVSIKEARIKEIKAELLNSDKLKSHFDDNPLDLDYLRHDKALHPSRVQPHMKHVPKYLMPKVGATASLEGQAPVGQSGQAEQTEVGFVPFKKSAPRGRGRGRGGRGGMSSRGRKKADPLKKFGR